MKQRKQTNVAKIITQEISLVEKRLRHNLRENLTFRKDCDNSVWCKCRNCSTMKTEKECLGWHEVEAVSDFNLHGIFVLSQRMILSELTHNLMDSISISFCKQTWFQSPFHF